AEAAYVDLLDVTDRHVTHAHRGLCLQRRDVLEAGLHGVGVAAEEAVGATGQVARLQAANRATGQREGCGCCRGNDREDSLHHGTASSWLRVSLYFGPAFGTLIDDRCFAEPC